MRRSAILQAAMTLLTNDGAAAVTPASVAGVAGLARSSVYQYYASTGALIGASVEETFHRSLAAVEAAMRRARTPRGRLTSYVDASLEAAMAGHEPTMAYAGVELPPEFQVRLAELHAALTRPLLDALHENGVRDASGVAELIRGVIVAGARQVREGETAAVVRARVRRFVLASLGLR